MSVQKDDRFHVPFKQRGAAGLEKPSRVKTSKRLHTPEDRIPGGIANPDMGDVQEIMAVPGRMWKCPSADA